MDYFTPGVLFWYASGDDSNQYNGSERMPTVEGSWAVLLTASMIISVVFRDMLGLSNDGTMGVYLQGRRISPSWKT